MIGLLVLLGRTNAPSSLVPEMFGPARVHVPKAPGLGLLLENPLFEVYNTRIASTNRKLEKKRDKAPASAEVERLIANEARDLVGYEPFRPQMNAFKQKFIYDRIFKTEEETAE